MGAAENGRLECLDHLIATHLEKKAHLNAQVPSCWLAYADRVSLGCLTMVQVIVGVSWLVAGGAYLRLVPRLVPSRVQPTARPLGIY